jgi:6-phosphofructokinase 1
LLSVIEFCQITPEIGRIWGARLGWQGVVQADWIELTEYENRVPPYLEDLPGAALGSGRYRLTDEELPRALEHLHRYRVGAVFVIGGNGSMAAAHKLHQAALSAGYSVDGQPLRVVGVPKTIDNDLNGTDFAPGYGSAARFIAQTVRDVGLDLWSMRNFDDVAIVEVMGRHVGWLAAASALARHRSTAAPHLILLPEAVFDEARFLAAVKDVHEAQGICLVVSAEGIRDAKGRFLAEQAAALPVDASGQKLLSLAAGVAPYLARLVQEQLGLRCRQIRPDLIQRSSSTLVSRLDRRQAARSASFAVESVLNGMSDVMIGLKRLADGWMPEAVPLADVLGKEKTLPPEFIDEENFDVTDAFITYARPLAGDLNLGAFPW